MATKASQAKNDIIAPAISEDAVKYALNVATLLANDTGANAKQFVWPTTPVRTEQGGTLTFDQKAGKIFYTPPAKYAGLDAGEKAADSFSYSIKLANGKMSTAKVNLTVAGSNDAPVATMVTLPDTAEDTPITITAAQLLAGASDIDGEALNITDLKVASGGGTLTKNADGVSWTYTPGANASGPVSFNYTVSDGTATAQSTASLNVTPVNEAPAAAAVTLPDTAEETPITITATQLLAGSSDTDGDVLRITDLQVADGVGTLVKNADGVSWTYTPAKDSPGPVLFNFTVSDGRVTATSTASLNVTPVDDAPVAYNTTYSINEDAQFSQTVEWQDGDGGPVPVELVRNVEHGTLTLGTNGKFTYVPNANFSGVDYFTFKIGDSQANVTFDVTAANDAPVATAITLPDVAEKTSFTITPSQLLAGASDVDGDTLTITDLQVTGVFGSPSLVKNTDGTWTYTSPHVRGDFVSLTYTVSDGITTAKSTASFNITSVDDLPDTAPNMYVGYEDTPLVVATREAGVLDNDFDIDHDSTTLTAVLVEGPTHGDLTLNSDGTFTYAPDAEWSGEDSFTYAAKGGDGIGNTATVRLLVNALNDAPVAVNDRYTVNEDEVLYTTGIHSSSFTGVLGNDLDKESAPYASRLSAELVSGPTNGTLNLSADGAFAYTPNPDYSGPDSFTYRAFDGEVYSDAATVSITVNPMPEPVVDKVMDFEGISDVLNSGDYYYWAYEEDGLLVDGQSLANHFHVEGGTFDWNYNTWISTHPTGGNEYISFYKADGSTFDFKGLDVLYSGGMTIKGSNGEQYYTGMTGTLGFDRVFDDVTWIEIHAVSSKVHIDNVIWA